MPVAFDTAGMEQFDERTWFDPRTGDQVSLTYIGLVPDLPAPLGDLPLLRHRLALETAEVGALIEAHVVMIDSVPTLFQLLKLPIPNQEAGQAFIAAFTIPKATCSAVLRIQCTEGGSPGMRESAVFAQVGTAAFVRPHPYAPDLEGRLPWHVGDGSEWDEQFPDHPLTRARAWAEQTIATARVEPGFAVLPPFYPTENAHSGGNDFAGGPEPDYDGSTEDPTVIAAAAVRVPSGTGDSGGWTVPESDSSPADSSPSVATPLVSADGSVGGSWSSSDSPAAGSSSGSGRDSAVDSSADSSSSAAGKTTAEDLPKPVRRQHLDPASAWQLPPDDAEPSPPAAAKHHSEPIDVSAVMGERSSHPMALPAPLDVPPKKPEPLEAPTLGSMRPAETSQSTADAGQNRVIAPTHNAGPGQLTTPSGPIPRPTPTHGAGPPGPAHPSGPIDSPYAGNGQPSPAYTSGAFPRPPDQAHPSGAFPHPSGAFPNPAHTSGTSPHPSGAFPNPTHASGAFPHPSAAFPNTAHTSGTSPHPSGAFPNPTHTSGAYPQPQHPSGVYPGQPAPAHNSGAHPHQPDPTHASGSFPRPPDPAFPAANGHPNPAYASGAYPRPPVPPPDHTHPSGPTARPGSMAQPPGAHLAPSATGSMPPPGMTPSFTDSPAPSTSGPVPIPPNGYPAHHPTATGSMPPPGAMPPAPNGYPPGAMPTSGSMSPANGYPAPTASGTMPPANAYPAPTTTGYPASGPIPPDGYPTGIMPPPNDFPTSISPANGFPAPTASGTMPATGYPAPGNTPPANGYPAPTASGTMPPANGYPAPTASGTMPPANGYPAPTASGTMPATGYPGTTPPANGYPAPTASGTMPAANGPPATGATPPLNGYPAPNASGHMPALPNGQRASTTPGSSPNDYPTSTMPPATDYPAHSTMSPANGYPAGTMPAYPGPTASGTYAELPASSAMPAAGHPTPTNSGVMPAYPGPTASGTMPAAGTYAELPASGAMPSASHPAPTASGVMPAVGHPASGAMPSAGHPAPTSSGVMPAAGYPAPTNSGTMSPATGYPAPTASGTMPAVNGQAPPPGPPMQRVPGPSHPSGPVKAGGVMHTVLIGLPIGGFVPLWHNKSVSYWRMSDPDAVRARLGVGIESRTEIDNRRFREAGMFSPDRQTLFLMDRYRDETGNLGGATTQLIPATEEEAFRAANDRAMSDFYSWIGDVVVAAGERGEYVAIEAGGWQVPVTPVVLIMLRTDGREWHSVVETSPVPVGAPVWRDQQPVGGDTQLLASPATDRTMRAAGLLTRFAVATWPVHPFQLGLSFGPNPTLGDVPTR